MWKELTAGKRTGVYEGKKTVRGRGYFKNEL